MLLEEGLSVKNQSPTVYHKRPASYLLLALRLA